MDTRLHQELGKVTNNEDSPVSCLKHGIKQGAVTVMLIWGEWYTQEIKVVLWPRWMENMA